MTSIQIFYIAIAAVIAAAAALLRFIYKKSFMLQTPVMPKPPLPCQPDDYYLPYENVLFSAADGVVLKGWFIPSLNEDSSETVIICHGRGSNKGQLLQKTHFLAEKYNLFYFDFRACGESKGNMSTIGYMETRDFDAAYTFLKTNKEGYADRIAVMGCSVGGSVAVYGAAKYPEICGIVAESTFLSLRSVVENWCRSKLPCFTVFVPLSIAFYRRRLKTDPELFSPLFNVPRVKCPALFIYGDNDRLIPAADRNKLVNMCGSSDKEVFIISGATHTKCAETGGVMYRERISDFLEKIFRSPESADASEKKYCISGGKNTAAPKSNAEETPENGTAAAEQAVNDKAQAIPETVHAAEKISAKTDAEEAPAEAKTAFAEAGAGGKKKKNKKKKK